MPPARVTSWSSACGGSGACAVLAEASASAASWSRGPGRTCVARSASAANPPSWSRRRVVTTSHGRSWTVVARWRSRSALASSIRCASSKTSIVGVGSATASRAAVTSWTRALRKRGSSRSVSGVSAKARSSGTPSKGSHGSSSGASTSTRCRSRVQASSADTLTGRLRTPRSSERNGKYGVEDSYSSLAVVSTATSAAADLSSATSRDLPMPGSPTTSTSRPCRFRASSSAAVSTAISAARPTSAAPSSAGPAWAGTVTASRGPISSASTG